MLPRKPVTQFCPVVGSSARTTKFTIFCHTIFILILISNGVHLVLLLRRSPTYLTSSQLLPPRSGVRMNRNLYFLPTGPAILISGVLVATFSPDQSLYNLPTKLPHKPHQSLDNYLQYPKPTPTQLLCCS